MLPNKEGEACRYSAELKLGRIATLQVVAEVRAGESKQIDGRLHRWIEVWVEYGEQGAMLLVDEDAYTNEKRFVVSQGWYQLNDEVFDFAGGDATVAEESLRWLEKPTSKDLFKPHDVLALLFDADLPSVAETVKGLRSKIPQKVGEANAKRKPEVCVITETAASQKTFVGKRIVLDSDVFPFEMQFSREIPFGFGLVSLTLQDFQIGTQLMKASNKPSLFGGEIEMRKRASLTQAKLDNKDVRAWTINGQTIVRQFNRYLNGKVRLNNDPSSTKFSETIDWDSLSRSDRAWIFATQGHDWDCLKKLRKQRPRALIKTWGTSGVNLHLLWDDGDQGEEIRVEKRSLSPRDRTYEKEVLARIR